jgi:thymidine phosphorylase
MPIGPTAKIFNKEDIKYVKNLFLYLSRKFNIKTKIIVQKTMGPIGKGIGPCLEARDVMRVLQQKQERPKDLEKKSILLAGSLLELTGKAKRGNGQKLALEILQSGKALRKMREIIKAQGGNSKIDSEEIALGKITWQLESLKGGLIKGIHNKNLNRICRLLGAPSTKEAGIYLNKTVGDNAKKEDILCTLYTNSEQRLILARHALKKLELYEIGKPR